MLESPLIRLRALEPEDLELLYRWENDPQLWTLSNSLTPYSRFVLRQYLEHATQDIFEAKQLRLIIEQKAAKPSEKNNCIGAVDLFDFEPLHQRAGIGILIYSTQHRQRGYGSDVLRLLKNYCFGHLQLRQLYCNILSNNEASIALFQQAGFVQCGLKKQWVRQGNEWLDEGMYQLLAPEVAPET